MSDAEEAPSQRVRAEDFTEELASLLPYDQPGRMLETLITWGRFANLFDYDQKSDTLHPREGEDEEEHEDEEEDTTER